MSSNGDVSSSVGAATTWSIDVDAVGVFRAAVSPPFPPRNGNYRITVGDTLVINVPAGSLVNQNDVHLVVTNGVGEESMTTGVPDVLGHLRFEWLATSSGSCSFRFDYVPFATPGEQRQSSLINRVIVAPRIIINNKLIPVESLSMQTVMSRCLGPLDTWVARLKQPTADLHYNVIHFTPVQVTGESGSCYSLADQLEMASEILPAGSSSSGFDLLGTVIRELESRYGLMSTSDIVLNHTANDTHWIPQHPECGYNERNSPHLTAPIELDISLQNFSLSVAKGYFRDQGLSPVIEDENALKSLRRLVQEHVLNPFRLGEWFEINIDAAITNFQNVPYVAAENKSASEIHQLLLTECLNTVGVARKSGVCPSGEVSSRLCKNVDELRSLLRRVQDDLYRRAGEVNDCILNSIEGYVRWERLQCRKGSIGETHWNALVPRYFTPVVTKLGETLHLANNGWVMDWDSEKDFAAPGSLVYLSRSLVAWSDCIKLRYGDSPDDCPFLWELMKDYCAKTASIFHGIRLDNCHSTPIHVAKYCLKESRKVNPNLWVYAELFTGNRETDLKFERELGLNALIREAMQSYNAKNLAHHIQEFGGRQNIGSFDPISSLNRLSDSPRPLFRTLSPSLYFDCTHDNETPQQKRTAIDALPNAAAVAASYSAIGSCRGYDELVPKVLSVVTENRLYHDYKDKTNGARNAESTPDFSEQARFSTSLHAESSTITAKGSWDAWKNEIVLERRHGVWSAVLPSQYFPQSKSDFVVYEYKFISNGHDWFFDPSLPHSRDSHNNINNTISIGRSPITPSETPSLIDARRWKPGSPLPGIMEARKVLNETHRYLSAENFTELDVETRGEHLIILTRHQPSTHRMCLFFVHSAFTPAVLSDPKYDHVIYEIKGKLDEVILEAKLSVPEDSFFVDEQNHINGLSSRLSISSHSRDIKSNLGLFDCRYDDRTDKTILKLTSFLPGSVLVIMTRGFQHIREAVAHSIQDIETISQAIPHGTKISRNEELHAYSYLLYSCNNEERDRSRNTRGCYELGGDVGVLPYAGICGLIPLFDKIRYTGDMNHPLIHNVIDGDWLIEYSVDRLDTDKDDAFSGAVVIVLLKVASWLREAFAEPLRYFPRKLLPSYLDWIVSSLYSWVAKRIMSGVPEPLRSCSDPFMIRLCLATLQFYSFVPSSPLIHGTNHPSLCAGLPHFSTEYMRNWGRDTFISLKGCLIATGRFQEAREEILGFARVMRHGLIPNLLDSGNNPRYNARDATWFFLQAVQDYCATAPEGNEFLKMKVSLKYSDVLPEDCKVETVADLIHTILSQHAKGIEFREWNAGTKIDSCMKDEGFNIKITFDRETGLVFGGNKFNCGTWMDKMGSSYEAGTVGVPATPRDGAAVEIIGLLKSALRFVTSLRSSVFDYEIADPTTGLTYKEWDALLQKSFEKCFYLGPIDAANGKSESTQKVILRDSFKASESWRDNQLRPNFCIALAVAPELVSSRHALAALETVSSDLFQAKTPSAMQELVNNLKTKHGSDAVEVLRHLNGSGVDGLFFTTQLGLKTLDPTDYKYRPNYNNDDRSTDANVSAGFNYHNGPEWVWPVGYFLDALFFYTKQSEESTSDSRLARFLTMRYLLLHRQHTTTDKWISLPEVTDHNGRFCPFSCPAQAWSVGTLLGFHSNLALSSGIHTTPTARTASTMASPTETPAESPKAVDVEVVKKKK